MSLLDDCYISYLNLDHRTDRKEHMEKELKRVGISAIRTRGKIPTEIDNGTNPKYKVMWNRTKGAIPCHYGQVEIMAEALRRNKHAMVCEDDLVFCSDFQERIIIIEDFLNKHNWDIFWLGGTYHYPAAWWHKIGHSEDLPQCDCKLGVDAEHTEDKRFMRTYGAFSTHCYIVNKNFIEPLLEFLEQNVQLSMGIDWLMILAQPQINTYAFIPGCVKQMDNQSDIGNGITYFSGFKTLGNHWFQDKMSDYNYEH